MIVLDTIVHGSEDSVDKDVYIVIGAPIASLQECKEVCESFPDYNANLVVIRLGKVVWCYKGTIDEVNNSIYNTYSLHKENTKPCPIVSPVFRDVNLKVDRTIRGILSYMSRTHLRTEIKTALKSNDLDVKIEALKLIDLLEIKSFGKKGANIEVYKFLAFQLTQTLALMQNFEIFTKAEVRALIPSLTAIINREEDEQADVKLQTLLNLFIIELNKKGKTK